jgi:hypothetical protein
VAPSPPAESPFSLPLPLHGDWDPSSPPSDDSLLSMSSSVPELTMGESGAAEALWIDRILLLGDSNFCKHPVERTGPGRRELLKRFLWRLQLSAMCVAERPGTAMTVGTVTVSSQIKDPSIVFRFLPSCLANRHAMKLGEQTATPQSPHCRVRSSSPVDNTVLLLRLVP